MLRRLHSVQPESFAFTPANQAWAEAQISKFPEGRQASAIIPLLWRAQEQEGWLSRPAMEGVADMLGLAHIRALEVATFYFMFQLQPVGSIANVQVCGTTSCMICGAEDLVAVCRDKIAPNAHQLSADGKFSWEEVECLGACANAPMAQIGKDYYEDLTAERLAEIIDELAAGKVPVPGPQNGRYASEPLGGLTSLETFDSGRTKYNASAQLAVDQGDTIKRIDGTELPLTTPWRTGAGSDGSVKAPRSAAKPTGRPRKPTAAENSGRGRAAAKAGKNGGEKPAAGGASPTLPADSGVASAPGAAPKGLNAPRDGEPDDLKMIKGVGPKLEQLLNRLGFFHFDQIAGWTANEISWVDDNLAGFKGRVTRDSWVDQAKMLASGNETEFSKRAKY